MNDSLLRTAKEIGTSIIDECVGFKTEDDAKTNIDVDLIASVGEGDSVLRLWMIRFEENDQGDEISNNIQLTFLVERQLGRTIAEKGAFVSREDLRTVLHL